MEKLKIKEVIIVEGRDDTAAINVACDANTIETHGFGIGHEVWKEIEKAYNTCGIIIFTDPDRAGENIREKIKKKYPRAKEAFLSQKQAIKSGNIGVENAKPKDIQKALLKAHCNIVSSSEEFTQEFTMEDMIKGNLIGNKGSREKRELLAEKLGIGYGSGKSLLKKMNKYGIRKEDFYGALQSISDSSN